MQKILVLGSANLDFVYEVPHIVVPGETLASNTLETFPGGKGLNQAIALAHAGAKVYFAGKVGSDGTLLVDVLQQSGVDTTYVQYDETPTGHAVIQVSEKGQNSILLYQGANFCIQPEDIDKAMMGFEAGDILLMQNEISNVAYAMHAAHHKGMHIAYNPSPIGKEIDDYPLELVSWIILNEIEAQQLSGKVSTKEMLASLRSKYPKAAIVLTLGKDGVMYDNGSNVISHGIYKVPVVDTTAAGDTFTGYFLDAVVAGESSEEALRLASVASSLAVSQKGASTSIPYIQQVRIAQLEPNRA